MQIVVVSGLGSRAENAADLSQIRIRLPQKSDKAYIVMKKVPYDVIQK